MLPGDAVENKALPERIEGMRSELLSLPSDTSGLDLERVDEFRVQIGAPNKPVLFLAKQDFQAADELVFGDQDSVSDLTVDMSLH